MSNPWDRFSQEKLKKIFTEKQYIIDIGGGLRLDKEKGGRINKKNLWLKNYLEKVNYKILDKEKRYNPDIVGDVHKLPLEDNSAEAIICLSVLQHVAEPQKAVKEIYRVLKPGGYFFAYVPFLYYYHPLPGYYKDFYRFTYDGVKYLTRNFKQTEIQNVRGAVATAMNLFPVFSKRTRAFDFLDKIFKKQDSRQTSGYNIFCVK